MAPTGSWGAPVDPASVCTVCQPSLTFSTSVPPAHTVVGSTSTLNEPVVDVVDIGATLICTGYNAVPHRTYTSRRRLPGWSSVTTAVAARRSTVPRKTSCWPPVSRSSASVVAPPSSAGQLSAPPVVSVRIDPSRSLATTLPPWSKASTPPPHAGLDAPVTDAAWLLPSSAAVHTSAS